MKAFFLLIALLASFISFSQSESQKYEDAYFQVQHKNESAFLTTIKSPNLAFTKAEFREIKDTMLKKEGIFKVEIVENDFVINVYHLSYIEVETIKFFVLPIKSNISLEEKVPFEF